ncbi:MAG: Spy/CpxP family protein refolding chaperone [Cyclobacteriaceae bacterium]
MKKTIIGILLLLLVFPAYSQRNREIDKEKLEAARVAFITNRLSLTPSQAEKFWPLFNQHQDSRDQMMRELHKISKTGESNLNNDKAKELIKEKFSIQEKMLENEKKFINKLSETLTPVQAFQLNEANRDFTRHIYRMQRRGSRPGGSN